MSSACPVRSDGGASPRRGDGGYPRTGGRRAVRHASARRPGGARHQGGAPRRGRLRPRLRRDGAGAVEPLRLAEPVEGIAHPRPEAPRSARGNGAAHRPGRRLRPEPGPGRGGAAGPRCRDAPRAPAAPHRLQHLRLRRHGSVPRQEGVRPARAGGGGPRVDHGHGGRGGEIGHFGRRHRRRHVRLRGHPDRAASSHPGRGRSVHRSVDAGGARRVDGLPPLLHPRRGITAAPERCAPCRHRALRPVCRGGRRDLPARGPERAGVGPFLRGGAGAAGSGPRLPLRRQREAGGAPRRAGRADPRGVRRADGRSDRGAAGAGRHRQCADALGGPVRRPPPARDPRPVARHAVAGRTDPDDDPARDD